VTASSGTHPLLVVIGTGRRQFREYLLRSIARDYRVHLLLWAEPTWEREYSVGWTVLTDVHETIDPQDMIDAVRELDRHDPVAGVLAWDEARILQCAKVAAALGLTGGDPDATMRCRDKHLTRQALSAAGVSQPVSILAATVDEALAAATEIGYPVILKPRAMAASLGVVKVASAAELASQFSFARDTTVPGAWRHDSVLVEEFVDGPEVSIDSVVYKGQVQPMCLARKEIGYPPYCEEVGHTVDSADPLLSDRALLALLQEAHAALGFTDGATHTEVKLAADGMKVIEVNGRLGGGMIPYLGLRTNGIDPGLAAAAVACGQPPATDADRSLAGAVRFLYVDHDDTLIRAIEFDPVDLPSAVDLVVPLVASGAVVSPPPKGTLGGRIAYITAIASTVAECQAGIAAAAATLRLT
jgi:biotin carboxylase